MFGVDPHIHAVQAGIRAFNALAKMIERASVVLGRTEGQPLPGD